MHESWAPPVWLTAVAAGIATLTGCYAVKTNESPEAPVRDAGRPVDAELPPHAFVEISASETQRGAHTCARRGSGEIACWGSNRAGALGDGTIINRAVPVAVMGIADAVQIAAGQAHTCAVRSTGAVACWGAGRVGELGDGWAQDSLVPVESGAIVEAVGVAAGELHTCALSRSGSVACWGENNAGQTGDLVAMQSLVPTGVPLAVGATEITVGHLHSCALLADGRIACWGSGRNGQLGQGSLAGGPAPVIVQGIDDAVEVDAGGWSTCARRRSGAVVCWGDNRAGQVGNGSTGVAVLAPVEVREIRDAVQISAGLFHTCALLPTGEARCWGANPIGQLGDGDPTSYRTTPVRVAGLSDIVEIDAGSSHTCARQSLGAVLCWGYNNEGELGDGTTSHRTTPVLVRDL